MSTITLPNIRVGSDLQVRARLKDGGVAIDWSTLQNIKACIYSDAQRALAGRCAFSIDEEDSTLLVCTYAANKPQYLGVNRIVISAKYMGETKTYDKPAFSFVRWTADQEGEEITIDDPDVDVEIDAEDISSSILQEAVDAAFTAADRANDAAAAAEHMVDIHTGPEGKSAYEVAVEEGYTGTEEEWLASLVGPQGQQGIQGETGEAAGFGTVSVSLQEDGGQPSATVAASGTDTAKNFAFTFNNLKGEKGDKGDQGNSGYTGAAGELEVVNNLTDGGAAKALSAEMGKTLEGEVSQLEAKVDVLGEYESVPDFVRVYTDSDDRILWGIKADGTTHAAAGFEVKGEVSLDGGNVKFVDNPEFVYVKTDDKGHILFGIQKDGNILFGRGVPSQIVDYIEKRFFYGNQTLEERLEAKVDKEDGKSLINAEYASLISFVESSEFIEVTTDNNGMVVSSREIDGVKNEYVGIKTPEIGVAGATIKKTEDIEGRIELLTDADDKILSFRDGDGIKHEVGIVANSAEFNHLSLSSGGMTEFQQALKDSGFQPGGAGDWSDYVSDDGANSLCISEPRCAMLNILSDIDLTTLSKKGRAGASKGINYDVPVEVEFYDMQGNYFKKWAEIGGQGNSSMTFVKKNIAVDLFDDETRDGAFSVKFGDWVAQDSYHIKSYYTDFFKGVSNIAYKIAMQAQKTRGIFDDISWKKAIIDKESVTDNPWEYPIPDLWNETNYEARCMPDGFPIIVYQQGQFYGVFALCLKKHRDNYHMDKGKDTHIHLDGLMTDTILFDANGNVDWTQFEVRNPKNLYYKEEHNGTYSYDADFPGQYEIADQTTVNAWIAAGQFPDGTAITSKIEKQLKATAKVHQYVENLSYRYRSVVAESTTAAKMAAFEQYFDPDNLIDYLLINMAVGDGDGFGPNWQWTTWDGVKWFVNQYDKDNTFGADSKGFFINGVRNPMTWYGSGSYIMAFIRTYYMDRIKARWNELVNAGVFTKENFLRITNDWVARIGYNNLYREYKEKWTESPCCRDPKVSENWVVNRIYSSSVDESNYDPETVYMNGDTCKLYQLGFNIEFECVVDNTQGVSPCYRYNLAPIYLGFYDNIWRVAKFIEDNLSSVNTFINNL